MTSTVNGVEEDLTKIQQENFINDFRTGYIYVKDVCLPEYYQQFSKNIENLEVRDDDVWICSFPKTGTTWTQEMVWCIANDLNFDAAKVVLSERFPFLEFSALFDYRKIMSRTPELQLPLKALNSVKFVDELVGRRFIKTHLPFRLLPKQIRMGEKKPKMIYVARNAKDTCVSYFHHCQLLEGYRGNFDDFCRLFLGGKLCFTSFWNHIIEFWEKRGDENILFLRYEDMKRDLPSVIRKTADFMGKKLDDQQVETLSNHLSFASMKTNPAVNYEDVMHINRKYQIIKAKGEFMRSGKTNQWQDIMSSATIDLFDRWNQNKFQNAGITV